MEIWFIWYNYNNIILVRGFLKFLRIEISDGSRMFLTSNTNASLFFRWSRPSHHVEWWHQLTVSSRERTSHHLHLQFHHGCPSTMWKPLLKDWSSYLRATASCINTWMSMALNISWKRLGYSITSFLNFFKIGDFVYKIHPKRGFHLEFLICRFFDKVASSIFIQYFTVTVTNLTKV